jgi:hypothetical protein
MGYGLLEKVYENALLIALQDIGVRQKMIRVFSVDPLFCSGPRPIQIRVELLPIVFMLHV